MTVNPDFADRLQKREAERRAGGSAPELSSAPEPRACVLVVDDEPEITRSVAELLGRDYEVLIANSADEALALLEANSVAVILTDQRIPGGTGAELLAFSLAIAPDATRILFTGYSDISAVIDAVNEGQVYHYLTKPWRPDELRAVISQGVARHDLVLENRRLVEMLTQTNEELDTANRELTEFAYSIAHDLRAPLRTIDGFSAMVVDDAEDRLSETDVARLRCVREAAQRMGVLIDHLLALSRASRMEMLIEDVDLSAMARSIIEELRESEPARQVDVVVTPGLRAEADAVLLRVILANLLGNAWKFTSKHHEARIEVGVTHADGERVFCVRDDGAGFDPRYAAHLFGTFQRMHAAGAFAGEGIGLATVRRLVTRHGGRVWAEAEVEKGATFFFTLGRRP
jgi:signal transduction histidine kinase